MAGISLTAALREEYQGLFDTAEIRPKRYEEVERTVDKVAANRPRYEAAGSPIGIPWYFIGAVHNMESSLRFDRHLHNGDPLTARTKHVPKDRPRTGNPPFTWEESASDAMACQGLDKVTDWSLPGVLFHLEAYNGWGYRKYHPKVLSPYLWSYSSHYLKGKYIADGSWSATAVSQQCGAATILRRMAERNIISVGEIAPPVEPRPGESQPIFHYSNEVVPHAEDLQRLLNTLPGVYLKVDGKPGGKTSAAFKLAAGCYLSGDPRGK